MKSKLKKGKQMFGCTYSPSFIAKNVIHNALNKKMHINNGFYFCQPNPKTYGNYLILYQHLQTFHFSSSTIIDRLHADMIKSIFY
jgi:hypothetical protein